MNKLKVLVAESDSKVLFAFSKVLEKEGCICIQSDNVDRTIKELAESNPSALFLDISRSQDANEKLFEEIKNKDPALPVVIISSHITDEVRQLAESIQALQIIEKPLRLGSVRQCLDRIKAKIIDM